MLTDILTDMKKAVLIIVCAISYHVTDMAQASSPTPQPLTEPGRFAPLPRADNPFWRDSIPEAMRRSYIGYGEQYLGSEWTSLPVTLFAEFKTNGNRSRYEAACFNKRRKIAALAMAEIMEGRGRFTADIVNGIGSLCEETWWGIPAHYNRKFPVSGEQTVDLFNAETAGLMAWIRYMLKPQLETFAPGFCRNIDTEIIRRMLRPAAAKDYWWKKAGMNWNPWICSNWLTCILFCENDSGRMADGIGQIMKAMDAFVNSYPADGGCDEGAGYWDRAAASLFECIRLLHIATAGSTDRMTPKTREMMRYIYKMYIGNGYCVNFADCHGNRMQAQTDILLPMSLWLDDTDMKGLAAHIARENDLFGNPAALFDRSGNFPALGRELFMLRDIAAARGMEAREPRVRDVWLPDLQIMTARRGDLYVAVKGGTNGESHNHNDVGNFIVYTSGQPLVIDVGAGEYTAATFGKDRYSIWTMQSAYHNLPLINGTQQKDGNKYAARVVGRKPGTVTINIAGAYPEAAAVRTWQRTVRATDRYIELTEDYELNEYREPTRLVLITTALPTITKPGVIAIGSHRIEYNQGQAEPSVEDISGKMDSLLRSVWGGHLYRIMLTVKSAATRNRLKYRITK